LAASPLVDLRTDRGGRPFSERNHFVKHPTVKLKPPWERRRKVEIDELLAPLIQELWDREVMTLHCCQAYEGLPGAAQIEFASSFDVERFAELTNRATFLDVKAWFRDYDDQGPYAQCTSFFQPAISPR
jgi:hypothetical protein